MRIVVITSPTAVPGEADAIVRLLESGVVWRVHLRRPEADERQMCTLIESVPAELRSRLSLHSHFRLAERYGIGGIHLNSRCPNAPDGFSGLVSRSCHSLAELYAPQSNNYRFLSPVFDSISKSAYKAAFSADELNEAAACGNVVALGGITSVRLAELAEMGFYGAAMLGAVWEAVENDSLENLIKEIRCYNS